MNDVSEDLTRTDKRPLMKWVRAFALEGRSQRGRQRDARRRLTSEFLAGLACDETKILPVRVFLKFLQALSA
jgi:hypothetical protein